MLGVLLRSGFQPTSSIADADYIVVNTCGFLKAARDESKNEIESIIAEKKTGSKLIVTGCMINLHEREITESYPEIDAVLGSGNVDKVLDAIRAVDGAGSFEPEYLSTFDAQSYLENGDVPRHVATPMHYAYLKIAEGCRKRCSFCIIPKIKGRLKSKPEQQIVDECRALLTNGASEIILIAQDLGDYGKDLQQRSRLQTREQERGGSQLAKGGNLASLLGGILNHTNEHFWLRLMYLYPDEVTDEIIQVMKDDQRVCRYLDMPIQHINDSILKAMKRKTLGDDIRRTIKKLREKLPGIQIRTSLMVGFPGETDDQFEELLDFVRETRLENVGAFIYSDEDLARSSKLEGKVSEEVKAERYGRLMEVQLQIVKEANEEKVKLKQRFEVVVEGLHPDHNDLIVGRHSGQCPDIDGLVIINELGISQELPEPGQRYEVEVTGFSDYDLVARMVV